MMPVVLGGGKPYFEAGLPLELELELLGAESLPQHLHAAAPSDRRSPEPDGAGE